MVNCCRPIGTRTVLLMNIHDIDYGIAAGGAPCREGGAAAGEGPGV